MERLNIFVGNITQCTVPAFILRSKTDNIYTNLNKKQYFKT